MLFINAIREYALDLAPDPLTALLNTLQVVVLMLAVAYVGGLLVSSVTEPAGAGCGPGSNQFRGLGDSCRYRRQFHRGSLPGQS